MGAAMAENEHELFSKPLSATSGFRRADGKTWSILLAVGAVAVVIALIIEFSFEKPGIRWPQTQTRPAPAAAPSSDEPRTYDVAPPGAVPPPG
jgi:hypothetical protein